MIKFLKKTIIYCLLVLLFVILVNIIIDPANIISGIEVKIAEYISEGYNVTNVQNIEERLLQKNIIQNLLYSPSIIILGSSRIMQIGKKYYGNSCFNNGVSGASIEDLLAIYQLYIENGHANSIEKVVIGIDPWLFNKNNGQNRWESLSNEYYTFIEKDVPFVNRIPLYKYSQLVSPSYFQTSVVNIPKFIIRLRNKENIMPTYEYNNISFTRLSDGTIEYDLKYRSKTTVDIENEIKNYTSGEIYSLENYFELSNDIINDFNLFINKINENGAEVEFLLMPYPVAVYKYLLSNEKYKIISSVEEYISFFAKENNINIHGSYNPELFNLNTDDFYDGMHLNDNGIRKILKQR